MISGSAFRRSGGRARELGREARVEVIGDVAL